MRTGGLHDWNSERQPLPPSLPPSLPSLLDVPPRPVVCIIDECMVMGPSQVIISRSFSAVAAAAAATAAAAAAAAAAFLLLYTGHPPPPPPPVSSLPYLCHGVICVEEEEVSALCLVLPSLSICT